MIGVTQPPLSPLEWQQAPSQLPLLPATSHTTPMPRLAITQNAITEPRFCGLPALGSIPAVTQARASDDMSATTRSSAKTAPLVPRTEGCLVSGFVDLTNEFAHFVSAVRHRDREDKKAIIDLLVHDFKVIPRNVFLAAGGFTLEHASNMAWLATILHRRHDFWATIAISPCLDDLIALERWYSEDNRRRQQFCNLTGKDHGRTGADVWKQLIPLDLENKFQLTVLHPRHFHPDPEQRLNIRGPDGRLKTYKATLDGVLKDEDGVPLPPFSLSSRDPLTMLNPLLVNFPAALRFRRLSRMGPSYSASFSADTRALIDASLKLHAALTWTCTLPFREEELTIGAGNMELRDTEMEAGPSRTWGGMADPANNPATFVSGASSGLRESEDILSLFKTLGREEAVDVILGGYAFQPLPELVDEDVGGYSFQPLPDLVTEEEDGGASPPPPTTPPHDEKRRDTIPAETLTTDISQGADDVR
ncbi:hypothetical protein B0H19DRAFT_128105 [Mycena capillaripes]|nr:hypothetical protein B0H19DRAFT_128105 [Mycena capillaripes]